VFKDWKVINEQTIKKALQHDSSHLNALCIGDVSGIGDPEEVDCSGCVSLLTQHWQKLQELFLAKSATNSFPHLNL